MSHPIVLFGDSAFGEIAYEYFTYDSPYEVKAFTVDKEYMSKESLFGVPVVPFEEVTSYYPPDKYKMHIALVYNKLNRIRAEKFKSAKQKGYELVNYISSDAFLWRNVSVGENVFIFEDNTIQPFVELGNNIVLWSGNHIGHHSKIEDNCFISSHVVVSGFCNVGRNSFLGVNSTINNNIDIAEDCVIGSGCVVTKNTQKGKIYVGNPAKGIKSSYNTI